MQGDELKAIRIALGFTQRQMADAFDMSSTFIGLMERGERPIDRRTALSALYLRDNPEAAEELAAPIWERP